MEQQKDCGMCTHKKKLIIILLVVMFAFTIIFAYPDLNAVPTYMFLIMPNHQMQNDFSNYYYGGLMLKFHNPGIYNKAIFEHFFDQYPNVKSRHKMLNYPPLIYCLFSFFAIPDLVLVSKIWFTCNIVFWLGSLLFIYFSYDRPDRDKWQTIARFALYFTFGIFFAPAVDNILQGQVNMFLLFLCTGSFYFYKKKNPIASAVFLAFAISLKIIPAILLMFYFLKREYKTVLYTFAGIVLIHVIILLLWGAPLLTGYLQNQAFSYFGMGELTGWLNKSIAATLYRLFSISNPENNIQPIFMATWLVLPLRIIITLAVMTCLAFFTIRNYNEDLLFPLYLVSIFLVTPMVWVHHHVLILMALPLFTEYILGGKFGKGFGFLASILFIIFFWILGKFNGWVSFPMNPIPYWTRVWFHNSELSTFVMAALWLSMTYLIRIEKPEKKQETEQSCPVSDNV